MRKYGWVPDLPDFRDHQLSLPQGSGVGLPPSVDLRPTMPPVYDQGQTGSCTAQAISGAIEYSLRKNSQNDFVPSRLFIYWNERVIEGDTNADGGAEIRDGIKSVTSTGVCPENSWPFNPSNLFIQPPQDCFTLAKNDLVSGYARVDQTADGLCGAIAAGFPVVFGFSVYKALESSEVASTGILPMPSSSENMIGGHAVLAVGYDSTKQIFIVRNSWGSAWGQAGYFTMPWAYILNNDLSDDFWVIKTLSETKQSIERSWVIPSYPDGDIGTES